MSNSRWRRATNQFVGAAGLLLAMTLSSYGANILLVGGTLAPDNDLRDLLIGMGHVVSPINNFASAPPTTQDLAGIDLVLVSRSVASGDYDDVIAAGAEPALWNGINKPLLLMSPHISRGGPSGTRIWGWFNSATVTADVAAPTDFDPFPNPSHPFVAGRTTSVFPEGVLIDYINTLAIPTGATMVATLTVAGDQTVGIVDIPQGTTLFPDAQGTISVTGGRRVFFHMHQYPDTPEDAFELSANGNLILNQIINTIAPTTTIPGDVDGNGIVNLNDYRIIRDNFQQSVASRSQGDLNADGIVDFLDFRIWKNNRTAGVGAGFGGNDAVPEPASMILAILVAALVALTTRTRSAGAG